MSYKKVVKSYSNNEILYTDVDTTTGFIVGKYESNIAFIIIQGDWYLIFKDRIIKNSYNHDTLKYIFNNNHDDTYIKDVRYYDNFTEASQYINDIIGGKYD